MRPDLQTIEKRIYLTGGCGTGKSTFAEELTTKFARVKNFGNVVEKALASSRQKQIQDKGYSEAYARQSALYHYTKDKMTDRTKGTGTITIFERSILDWLDGSLGHPDPFVRKQFDQHLQSLESQKHMDDLWNRTRFIIVPAPSLAMIEKNLDIWFDGDKREAFYAQQMSWTDKTPQTLKIRMLHERFLDAEFSQLGLLRRVIPTDAEQRDCKIIHVRELPAYRNKNFKASTYFEWKNIVELILSEFLMEY